MNSGRPACCHAVFLCLQVVRHVRCVLVFVSACAVAFQYTICVHKHLPCRLKVCTHLLACGVWHVAFEWHAVGMPMVLCRALDLCVVCVLTCWFTTWQSLSEGGGHSAKHTMWRQRSP